MPGDFLERYAAERGRGPARLESYLPPLGARDAGADPAPGAAGKLRVCALLPWAVMGGADRFNLALLGGLDREHFWVSALTTLPSDNDWFGKLQAATNEAYALPQALSPDDFAGFVSRFIAARQIDLLLVTNTYVGYGLVPFLRLQFPGLAVVDYVHSEEWYWRNGGNARYSAQYSQFLDKTYTCNNATRRTLITHYHRPKDSVETVYVGVDANHYDPAATPPGGGRALAGVAEGRPLVLYPCRMTPEKRPFLMLEIAACLGERRPELAVVAAGDGPALDELRQQAAARQLDNLFFVGAQSEMRPLYQDAAVTLICSLREGLALTAYESLAMATPVVTADVGGMAELVDNHTGALVPLYGDEAGGFGARDYPAEEIEAYVRAILELVDSPDARQISENCRRTVVEGGFSTAAMVARFEAAFAELCASEVKRQRSKATEALVPCGPLAAEAATQSAELAKQEQALAAALPRLAAAEAELEKLRAMRSFALSQKYVNFRNNSPLGRLLGRLVPRAKPKE